MKLCKKKQFESYASNPEIAKLEGNRVFSRVD